MKFSTLTERIADDGADAWEIHFDGLARQAAGEDVIVLSIGEETEEVTPPPIVAAAVRSLRAGRHHYTPVEGNLDLRRAIAKRHASRTGQAVDAACCVVFAGAQNALFAVAQCLLEKGDEVILSAPYYTTYPATFSAAGADLISVAAKPEDGFQVDPQAIIAAITTRTRAIVLNSPNNPMGAVYPQACYQTVLEVCVKRGIWLLNDEVYQDLLHDDERANPDILPGAERVCITISSLSKSHRMTGWRLGWALAPPALAAHLSNLAMCMSYGQPAFIQDAALAALESANPAGELRVKLDRRRAMMLQMLDGVAGLKARSASGGMFVVFDVSAMRVAGGAISARQFARGLLDTHRVAVLPCDGFGGHGAHLVRVSLCVAEQRLKTACQRIANYAESLNASG